MFDPTLIAANTHAGRHRDGSTFGGAVERGAGWSLGRDLERTLFHLLPVWLIIITALLGGAFLAYRWWTNNKAKNPR